MEEKEERRAAVSRYSYDYISPISEPLPFGIERPEQNKNAYNDKQDTEYDTESIALSGYYQKIYAVSDEQYTDHEIYPVFYRIRHNDEQHADEHLKNGDHEAAVIVLFAEEINDPYRAYAYAEHADYSYAQRGRVLTVEEEQERAYHGEHGTDERVDRNVHIELASRRSCSRRRMSSVVFVV